VEIDEHPLAYLLHLNGWSATDYLTRLDVVHRRLGYGPICTKERKRVTRWTRHGVTPELSAQKAMAALHGIPEEEIAVRPWPEWLKLSCLRERQLLDAEWCAQTTIDLLEHVAAIGGPMDRRGFLVVTGVAPVLAGAATARPVTARAHGRRIGKATPVLFDQCLAILRRQDDQLGSGQVHASARAQLQLIISTLKGASYTDETGRRLYAAAAEAARLCAFTAYDCGFRGLAEEYYLAALRTAASCGNPIVTAYTLTFWASMRYSTGDPRGACDLVTDALRRAEQIGSPRMTAMLYADLARAHAHAGEQRSCAGALAAAFDAYDRARDRSPEEEPDCVYWVNLGLLRMEAGSCALNLDRPREALAQFAAAPAEPQTADVYREDEFPRSAVLFLTREAEALISLNDLDSAVDTAHRALAHMGGVSSARVSSALGDLRCKLAARQDVPLVREFLESTA
jgi:tetratricopeptide (TPR) repeat protein